MADALNDHISHLAIPVEPVEEQEYDPLNDIQHDMDEAHPQLTESDTADEGTATTEQQEDEVDWQAKYEEIQRESSGRLGTIEELRGRLRETSDNIENLRQMVLESKTVQEEAANQAKLESKVQEELEKYGENVVNDPHVAYMRDKINELNQRQLSIEQQRQARAQQWQAEQARRAQFAEQRQAFLQTLKAQEESFVEQHPDYDDAYNFARNKRKEMYVRRGFDAAAAEREVANEEAHLAQEQLLRGGNVAQEIYNWAKDYGWQAVSGQVDESRTTGQSDEAAVLGQANRGNDTNDFERIRRGLRDASLRSMDSNQSRPDAEYVTSEQFYKTVPEHIRAQVHADPELFEQLGRYGKIKKFW